MHAPINGMEMFYEEAGRGEPLLLIHGLGYDSTMWELQKPFSERYRIITMDLRGHGKSSRTTQRYSVELSAEDVGILCDFLCVKKAHVLDISMGGCVALKLAILFPNLVASLVLVNTFAKMEHGNLQDVLRIFSRTHLLPFFSMRRLASMSAARLFEKGTPFFEMAREKFRENVDCLKEVEKIDIPTLIIAGRNDRVVSDRHSRTLAERMKSSRLISFDGGHALTVENPEAFNETVLDFLSSNAFIG